MLTSKCFWVSSWQLLSYSSTARIQLLLPLYYRKHRRVPSVIGWDPGYFPWFPSILMPFHGSTHSPLFTHASHTDTGELEKMNLCCSFLKSLLIHLYQQWMNNSLWIIYSTTIDYFSGHETTKRRLKPLHMFCFLKLLRLFCEVLFGYLFSLWMPESLPIHCEYDTQELKSELRWLAVIGHIHCYCYY